ncbi:MAG: ABC transporter substrate-binding protein [Clostridiales Family XIII bacterium]|jgi:peptide/nickel transport system substrate-binding protein|nr:ABC transporter substrate-binding protein [Clostridiales Family XIII bacterium]
METTRENAVKHRGRRRAAVLVLAVFFCALCAAVLTACDTGVGVILGGGAEKPESATTVSPVVYLPMETVRTLNPVLSKDEDSYYIGKLVYDSLFALDDSLTATPSLVESYDYDESGLSVNIRLRSGLLWSDGEALDAADVVFSIEAYTADPDAHLFGANVRNIRSAKVVAGDPLSLVIAFRETKDTGVERLTFPILPAHLYRNRNDLRRDAENFIPVGSGPYIVQEFDRYSHLTLTGNPNRTDGEVPKNTLAFQVLPSRSDALNMLSINAISYAVSREGDRDTIYRDANMRVQSFPGNEAVWLGFNFNKELFTRKEVRRAVAFGVNSAELLEVCFFNSGVLADSIYYPGFLGVGEAADPYPADPDKAKSLLAAAGLSDTDGDGSYEYFVTDDGEDEGEGEREGEWRALSLKFLVNGDDASRVSAAQMIQAALGRIGLVCELAILDRDAYLAALATGDYDFYMGGGQLAVHYDLRSLLHSDYGNPIAYKNPVLDALLDDFTAAKSPQERRDLFAEIHAFLVEEIPYYCLFYKTYGAVASPALAGDISPHFDDIYRGCEAWQCVYEVPLSN